MTAAAILREIIAFAEKSFPYGLPHVITKSEVVRLTNAALAQVERDAALMAALLAEHDAVGRAGMRGRIRLALTLDELGAAHRRVYDLLRARELERESEAAS
jgi:hypothetical protein